MKRQKIFVGFFNNAPYVINYLAGFSLNGYDVTSVDMSTGGKYVPQRYQQHVTRLQSGPRQELYSDPRMGALMNHVHAFHDGQNIWKRVRREHDIYVFIGGSFFVEGHDLRELREMGKKIAVVFAGDQMMWPAALCQHMSTAGYSNLEGPAEWAKPERLSRKVWYLRTAEKTADLVVHQSSVAQLALRPYMEFQYPIDQSRPLEVVNHDVGRPVIIHAPLNYASEGTARILKALEALHLKGVQFDLTLIKDLDYYRGVEQLSSGHIYVGNLGLPHAGAIEFEALARGLTVVTNAPRNFGGAVQRQTPFLDAQYTNLEVALEAAITNRDLRKDLQKKGLRYIASHHDARVVCADIVKGINGALEGRLIKPDFFAKHFEPSMDVEASFHTAAQKQLANESWYRRNYRGINRSGITF